MGVFQITELSDSNLCANSLKKREPIKSLRVMSVASDFLCRAVLTRIQRTIRLLPSIIYLQYEGTLVSTLAMVVSVRHWKKDSYYVPYTATRYTTSHAMIEKSTTIPPYYVNVSASDTLG
jgi:hypothetical protein